MSRIVVTTTGSLGDLYPFVAIGIELQRRGHEVVIGTSPSYRQKVKSWGLEFHAVRPDCDWLSDPERVRRLSHPRFGLIRVGREWLMPAIRESYEDIFEASQGADLLVTMLATYATRLVAEKRSIPWVSAVHMPMAFYSAHDPPLLDIAPRFSKNTRYLGWGFWGPLFWLGKRASRFLAGPWYQLRAEIGLPPARDGNPLVDSHSPELVLALFSPLLASKQVDWPTQTVMTGFPFLDTDGQTGLEPELNRFLDAGPPPIVFTLGSALSRHAEAFYEDSLAAARLVDRRAVLVIGSGGSSRIPPRRQDVIAVQYAPFSELFCRAAVVVHHGGVGTTGQAMRCGRPMLVVPHAWDQPDNAERVFRLGIARTLSKQRYTAHRAAQELKRLLDDAAYSQRASEVAKRIRQEDGASAACNALESLLLSGRRS